MKLTSEWFKAAISTVSPVRDAVGKHSEGSTEMRLVTLALKQPYTVASVVILLSMLGVLAALRMPVDIFPEINIPVVSVVWTYNGMCADDIQDRILTPHERQMASLVDDISRMEASSYTGVGVIKVYLHEGADVSRAVSQLSSKPRRVVLNKHAARHDSAAHPALRRHGCADHPAHALQPHAARPSA